MRDKRWMALTSNGNAIRCCICGELIERQKDISREHEPPLSRGGRPWQWKYAHKWCNNQKGALTLEEYKVWLELEKKRHGNSR